MPRFASTGCSWRKRVGRLVMAVVAEEEDAETWRPGGRADGSESNARRRRADGTYVELLRPDARTGETSNAVQIASRLRWTSSTRTIKSDPGCSLTSSLEQPRREIVQGVTPGLPFVGQSLGIAKDHVLDAGLLQRLDRGFRRSCECPRRG